MVRLIGNVLVFGLILLLLSSCAGFAVKEITSYRIEKKREPLDLSVPSPLSLENVDWIIITKENAEEVFEKIKEGGGEYSLFALTDKGYEKLALNFADIRNKLAEQRQIILSYREYYEPKE